MKLITEIKIEKSPVSISHSDKVMLLGSCFSDNIGLKMKAAGFYTIDMGLESGDQEMRFKYLRRYQTDEMIIRCSEWFHKYGIAQLPIRKPGNAVLFGLY